MPSSIVRLERIKSLLKKAKAVQIKAKPSNFVGAISSPFKKIPIKNIIVGVMY
jgi:hypothetical protein